MEPLSDWLRRAAVLAGASVLVSGGLLLFSYLVVCELAKAVD